MSQRSIKKAVCICKKSACKKTVMTESPPIGHRRKLREWVTVQANTPYMNTLTIIKATAPVVGTVPVDDTQWIK